MKNQYFADENDYRKYGLLRCIADATGLDIGVIWLLTEDDDRNDGEFRGYLAESAWRRFDEPLHASLSRSLAPGVDRDVGLAATWDLVPGATYFNRRFSDDAAERDDAFVDGMVRLASCPIVFLDPDNGIEVDSVAYGRKGSSKYVFWSELVALFMRGHSLVVYQHYPRIERGAFEADRFAEFRTIIPGANVVAFSTPRAVFFVALQAAHLETLPRIKQLVAQRWAGQIEVR